MGNKQAKATTGLYDQERQRQLQNTTEDRSYIKGQIGKEQPYATGLRDEIIGGYRNLAGGKDVTGASVSGFGGAGTYSPKLIGLDPSLGNLEGRYNTLSGGLDRALPGYEELSKTGGISDAERAGIRSRANDTGTAMFGNLRNEMTRRNSVSGGYSPGMTASMGRLAREQGIAAGKNSRDTELGLASMTREGRLAGLGGMERIGSTGYAGATDIGNTRQRILEENAAAENQAAAHNASAGQGNSEALMRMQLQGLGGLQDMYGASPGELSRYDDMLLKERGLGSSEIGGSLGGRQQNVGPETSPWDRVMQGVGAVSGLGSAFYNPRRPAR